MTRQPNNDINQSRQRNIATTKKNYSRTLFASRSWTWIRAAATSAKRSLTCTRRSSTACSWPVTSSWNTNTVMPCAAGVLGEEYSSLGFWSGVWKVGAVDYYGYLGSWSMCVRPILMYDVYVYGTVSVWSVPRWLNCMRANRRIERVCMHLVLECITWQ